MSPEYLISSLEAGNTVALTAPFIMNERVLIGFALSPGEFHSVDLALSEFRSVCTSLYSQVNSPRIFHGLKRIWESLDQRGLRGDSNSHHVDVDIVHDTKLMAYLLGPDSGREVDFGEHRVQQGLTLAHLCSRYLGEEYPYRNTDLYGNPPEAMADVLAYDAAIICRLEDTFSSLMSPRLKRLYCNLELPLMFILDNMRRVGIGVDGNACAEEAERIELEMEDLAEEIKGGAEVDLRSDREVFQFLVAQDVQFLDQWVYQWRKVSVRALEDIGTYYPIVKKILQFREMGQDLSFLRTATGRERVHPVWGQTRSKTSRIYARNPAVQNVSRKLRELFVPKPCMCLLRPITHRLK
jgi:DNA polymerase I-like protein with 3'-5' exonuclease and polymerase domains